MFVDGLKLLMYGDNSSFEDILNFVLEILKYEEKILKWDQCNLLEGSLEGDGTQQQNLLQLFGLKRV